MSEHPERFIAQKRAYFTRLGLSVREALRLHEQAGLWERVDGKRDWGNVTEHCLVEVARVDVLADALRLPEDIRDDLRIAAALHDFFKKGETEIAAAEGCSWESFDRATEESTRRMRAAGFSERVIRLTNAVGHESLVETERIRFRETLSPEDVAYLVLHYVDDYTVNSDWARPAEHVGGTYVNDLDRRVDKNERNPRYAVLNEEGRARFAGATAFETQRRIGHLIEERIAPLLAGTSLHTENPRDLPQAVDEAIQANIANA